MIALTDFFEDKVSTFGKNIFLWEKKGDKYQGTTYAQTRELVYQFAAGLMSLGIGKGDRIALISEGRNEWVISELGILYAGAVNVPLSVKLGDASEIKFRVQHSGSKMLIASGNQLPKVRPVFKELPGLEKIVCLDASEVSEDNEISCQHILELGRKYLKENKDKFEERWRSVKPGDYANICYTSGTTSDPKGIILSHANYTTNVEQSYSLMHIPEYFRTLLILPWDHAFAHTAGIYCFMGKGASIASIQVGKTPMETLKNIPVNIKEIKPHLLMSVPSLAKNFRKNIEKGIRDKGKFTERLFNNALKVAYKYNGIGWDKGKGFRKAYKPLVDLYDKLIFSKIRENFGGELQFFIGGGALLDIELQRFFYAIGIPMHQGYGLSEASPVISSNAESKHKLGSSGFLVKDMDLRICDEDGNFLPTGEKGEIVIRGGNVMAGYWNNHEATMNTIKDGWLHTGDLGYMDEDGFLYVLGRFKSLLIADDGEKYSPEGIEEAFINQSPYIDQCMLYNNQNAYTIALLVPNKEAIRSWLEAENLSIESEEGQEAVLYLIESEINQYRVGQKYEKMFPQRWLPAAIGILSEPFTEDNKLLNSTMKMVRPKVLEKYHSLIEYLYTPEAKSITNEKNYEAIRKLYAR